MIWGNFRWKHWEWWTDESHVPGRMLVETWTWGPKAVCRHGASETVSSVPLSSSTWASFFLQNRSYFYLATFVAFTNHCVFRNYSVWSFINFQNRTSLLLILEVPPVSFGWVIAAVRHGLIKSRLDPVDGRELKQMWSMSLTVKTFCKLLWYDYTTKWVSPLWSWSLFPGLGPDTPLLLWCSSRPWELLQDEITQ